MNTNINNTLGTNTVNDTSTSHITGSKNACRPLNRTLSWGLNGAIALVAFLAQRYYTDMFSRQTSEPSRDQQMNWDYSYLVILTSLIAVRLGMFILNSHAQQTDNKAKKETLTDSQAQPIDLINSQAQVGIIEKVMPVVIRDPRNRRVVKQVTSSRSETHGNQTTIQKRVSLLATNNLTNQRQIEVYNIGNSIIADLKNLFDKEELTRVHFTTSYNGTDLLQTLEKAYFDYIHEASKIKQYLNGLSNDIPKKQEITEGFKTYLPRRDRTFADYCENFLNEQYIDIVIKKRLLKVMEGHFNFEYRVQL